MTHGEMRGYLRELYVYLFGPGYFPVRSDGKNWEDIYVWVWATDPEQGLPKVYIDIMANRGGDDAVRQRLQGRFGTFLNQ